MALYQNTQVRIALVISMLVAMIEASIQSENTESKNKNKACDAWYMYEDLLNCTIESSKLKARTYKNSKRMFRFIKNLSLNSEEPSTTADLIVEQDSDQTNIYLANKILVFFYKETENESAARKEFCSCLDNTHTPKKSILIPLHTIKGKDEHDKRVEEARRIKKDPLQISSQIKKALQFLVRVLNIQVCKLYIDEITSASSIRIGNLAFLNGERNMDVLRWLRNNAASFLNDAEDFYKLYLWILDQHKRYEKHSAFFTKAIYFALVNEIFRKSKHKMPKRHHLATIDELEKEFIEDREQIIKQIKDIGRICAKYRKREKSKSVKTAKSLLEIAKEHAIMHINILTNQTINPCIEKGVLNGYIFNLNKVNEQSALWNENLIQILLDSLYKYVKFKGNIKKAIKVVQIENKKISFEVKRKKRKEEFYFYFYINKLIRAFDGIDKQVRKALWIQDVRQKGQYKDNNKLERVINRENIEVCGNLIEILVHINSSLTFIEKKEVGDRIKEKIYPLLNKIQEYYTKHMSLEEIWQVLSETRKKICSLLYSAISDRQLVNTDHEDLVVIKKALKVIIEKVVNSMFCKHEEWIDYSTTYVFKEMVKKEERYIRTHPGISQILNYLGSFLDRFMYKGYERNLVYKITKDIDPKDIFKHMLDKKILYDIFAILERVFQIYTYINNLNTYDEIWNNPAVLYTKKYPVYNKKYLAMFDANIVYKSEKDKRIYKKAIKFTDRNLELFRTANTSADIEKIEGDISLFDSS